MLNNENYPNLELLVYKAKQMLASDEEFMATYRDLKEKREHVFLDFDVIVFPQIWGSTATGFDVTEDGQAAVGGCAMTKEYTTIVYEKCTETYVVFFGGRACYKVTNAKDAFFEDMRERNMASLSEAREKY